MKYLTVIMLALSLSACSTAPDKITAQYVSPHKYDNYSCTDLVDETIEIDGRVNTMHRGLQKDRNKDNAAMAVGLIVFWPALFFIDGDSPDANTYARLKGETEAISVTMIRKGC